MAVYQKKVIISNKVLLLFDKLRGKVILSNKVLNMEKDTIDITIVKSVGGEYLI